ncbi:MAG: uroporphyrinogen-III C-methyltransferase [Lautropia sp.]|nr:uroporphyrinogen-III C-methyltransferase [Lautropia sp.]
MSSDQQNNPQRKNPVSSAAGVSDAKIIPSDKGQPAAGGSQAAPQKGPSGTPGQSAAPSPVGGVPPASAAPAGKGAAPTAGAPAPAATPSAKGGQSVARPDQGAVRTSSSPAPGAPSGAGKTTDKSAPGLTVNSMQSSTAAASAPKPALEAPRRSGGSSAWNWLLLILFLLLAAAGWWYMQQRFLEGERRAAQQLQQAEDRVSQLESQIQSLRDGQDQIQSRGTDLESRFEQSSARQKELQALYDDVVRVRGDSRLAEAERGLELAAQHLALAGNVRGALHALEGAEKALAESTGTNAIALRRVILQDIEKLKTLPEADLTRSVARLDEVLSRIDGLSFLSDPSMPVTTGEAPAADAAPVESQGGEAPAAAASGDQSGSVADTLSRFYDQAVAVGSKALEGAHAEFNQLVKIRRVDDPERMLLAPDQKQAIREGVRLQLLNARISLLNRNETLFRADLARTIEALERFFDVEKADVKSSIGILTSLQSEPLQLKLPSLSDSMSALSAARAESEKR